MRRIRSSSPRCGPLIPSNDGPARTQDQQGNMGMQSLKTIRIDVVGSLLRPAKLKEARAAFDEGNIDAAAFRAAEDGAVADAVRLQEGVGLDVISDGEMRRLNF